MAGFFVGIALWLQGMSSVACPALATLTTPAHAHMHLQLSSIAGMPLIRRFGTVGNHGVVTGTQGFGVPPAALTAGLVGAEHIPKVGMFTSGAKSSIVAASM